MNGVFIVCFALVIHVCLTNCFSAGNPVPVAKNGEKKNSGRETREALQVIKTKTQELLQGQKSMQSELKDLKTEMSGMKDFMKEMQSGFQAFQNGLLQLVQQITQNHQSEKDSSANELEAQKIESSSKGTKLPNSSGPQVYPENNKSEKSGSKPQPEKILSNIKNLGGAVLDVLQGKDDGSRVAAGVESLGGSLVGVDTKGGKSATIYGDVRELGEDLINAANGQMDAEKLKDDAITLVNDVFGNETVKKVEDFATGAIGKVEQGAKHAFDDAKRNAESLINKVKDDTENVLGDTSKKAMNTIGNAKQEISSGLQTVEKNLQNTGKQIEAGIQDAGRKIEDTFNKAGKDIKKTFGNLFSWARG